MPDEKPVAELTVPEQAWADSGQTLMGAVGDVAREYGLTVRWPDAAPEVDRAAELQEQWQTASGQLWQVGRHRIMCGDSTSAEDVGRLMDGERQVDLCLTDPPYGIGWAYDSYEDTPENLERLVREFLPLARAKAKVVLATCGVANIWRYPQPTWTLAWFCPAGEGCGPWGFCCWQAVLAYGKCPYLSNSMGSRPDAFVLQESRSSNLHPCAKPLGVWKWLLRRGMTSERGTVLDPFIGSGTTLVACEQLNRIGFGMEIEPKYVAVALQRMQDAFGITGVLK